MDGQDHPGKSTRVRLVDNSTIPNTLPKQMDEHAQGVRLCKVYVVLALISVC